MGTLITASDLSVALSPATYLAIFDDANDGTVDDTNPAVVLVIERAEAEVYSFLPVDFTPAPAQQKLLRQAAFSFAISFSYERHPEYVRMVASNERNDQYARGKRIMLDLQETVRRMRDVTTAPVTISPEFASDTARGINDSPGLVEETFWGQNRY